MTPDEARTVYDGKLFDVTLERWGDQEREIIEHPGAVAIVAVDREGCLTLVRQRREAARKELLELPAGTLEEGETFTTLELKINFLKPVWKARLRAVARVVKQGRTVGMVECDITDDKESLVARATSTCMTLRGEQAKGR